MHRTVASAVEILTWINKRLADYPACAGFILDGMLNQLQQQNRKWWRGRAISPRLAGLEAGWRPG